MQELQTSPKGEILLYHAQQEDKYGECLGVFSCSSQENKRNEKKWLEYARHLWLQQTKEKGGLMDMNDTKNLDNRISGIMLVGGIIALLFLIGFSVAGMDAQRHQFIIYKNTQVGCSFELYEKEYLIFDKLVGTGMADYPIRCREVSE